MPTTINVFRVKNSIARKAETLIQSSLRAATKSYCHKTLAYSPRADRSKHIETAALVKRQRTPEIETQDFKMCLDLVNQVRYCGAYNALRGLLPFSLVLRRRLGSWTAIPIAMLLAIPACAQSGAPIKIGYSMSLTGGLAPNGRSALVAQRIWEEETNAKGGMLGRPVKLVYYDDKGSPSEIPAIYTKLLDLDKVDLIIGAYGTALTAPAMPIVIQRKKTLIGLLGLAVNSRFNYPNYFVMGPYGPDAKPAFTRGFFDAVLRQNPTPRSVAIVAADQEFSRNAADGARENAKQRGLQVVYERTYPPATADFAPIVRTIAAVSPDLVVVCSYPSDSVGMVRAVNELGLNPKRSEGPWSGCRSRPSRRSLDRCSTGSSITSSGCRCRRCNSPAWPI